MNSRLWTWKTLGCWAVLLSLTTAIATASVTNDREYQLGDDSEGASVGKLVGFTTSDGREVTFDSEFDGTPLNGLFDAQDLEAINTSGGQPIYVDVTARPGATAGSFGVSFDGVDDRLEALSLNRPDWYWDQLIFSSDPDGPYPRNYQAIRGRGMQLWVKPDGTQQNVRQDIALDSSEFGGPVITADNKWALAYDMDDADTNLGNGGLWGGTVDVAFDQWTNVMVVTGSGGGNPVMYVNGIAVATAPGYFYDTGPKADFTSDGSTEPQGLFIGGSDLDNDDVYENFFKGDVDQVELFLWGTNTGQVGPPDGQNWGSFDLATDNQWIAQQLDGINPGDINMDGQLNNDDVVFFVNHWMQNTTKDVGGLLVVDWDSRLMGDLNFDGQVNLLDWGTLFLDFQSNGVAVPSLAQAFAAVPEPASLMLLALGCVAVSRRRS